MPPQIPAVIKNGTWKGKRCQCNTRNPFLTLAAQLLRNHRWGARASHPSRSQVVENLGRLRLLVESKHFEARPTVDEIIITKVSCVQASLGGISVVFLFLLPLPSSDVPCPFSTLPPLQSVPAHNSSFCAKVTIVFSFPQMNLFSRRQACFGINSFWRNSYCSCFCLCSPGQEPDSTDVGGGHLCPWGRGLLPCSRKMTAQAQDFADWKRDRKMSVTSDQ